jgi:hypothetical protein
MYVLRRQGGGGRGVQVFWLRTPSDEGEESEGGELEDGESEEEEDGAGMLHYIREWCSNTPGTYPVPVAVSY